MPDFTVTKRGQDSSGRDLYATAYMWVWWDAICRELGFTPTITQGAFMGRSGGGAAASAGYHDGAGTFDLRVWNLTDAQVAKTIRVLRANGAAAWLRNVAHGGFTDPHIHFVLGSDRPLSSGANSQWLTYLDGGDGLSGGGRDYHPRPTPLALEPPDSLMEEDVTPEQIDKIVTKVVAALTPVVKEAVAGNKLDVGRDNKVSDDKVLESVLARLVSIDNALKASARDGRKR